MENNLLNPNQPGFMLGNSYIHLVISIIYEIWNIYVSFASNSSWKGKGDISKGFDWVWHKGFIYKTKCMAVKGDLLTLIEPFLFYR